MKEHLQDLIDRINVRLSDFAFGQKVGPFEESFIDETPKMAAWLREKRSRLIAMRDAH